MKLGIFQALFSCQDHFFSRAGSPVFFFCFIIIIVIAMKCNVFTQERQIAKLMFAFFSFGCLFLVDYFLSFIYLSSFRSAFLFFYFKSACFLGLVLVCLGGMRGDCGGWL